MTKAKMWKLDLTDYKFLDQEDKSQNFEVKKSIIFILTAPGQNIDGRQFLKHNKLADKIEACKKDHILLDAGEKIMIKQSAEKFKNWNRASGKLNERMLEGMEEVEVEEKQNLNDKQANK